MRLATVTLNGTLDRVIVIPGFASGQIQSSDQIVTLPSGKGLNVARTALALGSELMTTGLVAGQCGEWICCLLKQEKIPHRFVHLSQGESRISTIIVDPQRGQTTVINDLGPVVTSETWSEICLQLLQAIQGYPWVALCGSSLEGLPHSVYAELCEQAQARGQRVCLDARDHWLSSALPARPYLIKCNQHEAAEVLGCPIHEPRQAYNAALRWLDKGIERVVITLGNQGAVAVERGGAWHILAPRVQALCPIGSGDAMMAGVIWALNQHDPLPVAVQYGVALGAANTLVLGSGRCDLDVLPELLSQATIIALE